MAIAGIQLIYRLKDTVRLLIDYRDGTPPPDTFNFYWSSTSGGAYVQFATGVKNEPSKIPSIKDKIVFEFNPSQISGWDNSQENYLKMTEVIGGAESAQEGPMDVPTKNEMIQYADKMIAFGFDKTTQKFIPLAVDSTGKLL